MNRFHFSKGWGWSAWGLSFAVWAAAESPVTFNARVEAGERRVLTGSVVTLGPDVALAPGAEFVVRASDGVVFSPGLDLGAGIVDMHVGPPPAAKPAGPGASVEAFAASVRRAPGGLLVRYALPAPGRLNLRVLDTRGKTVFKTALPGEAGRHEQVLGFAPKSSGVYLMRAEFAGKVATQRVFLGER